MHISIPYCVSFLQYRKRLLYICLLRFHSAKSAGGIPPFFCSIKKIPLYLWSTSFKRKKKVFVYSPLTMAKPNGALSFSALYFLLISVMPCILEIAVWAAFSDNLRLLTSENWRPSRAWEELRKCLTRGEGAGQRLSQWSRLTGCVHCSELALLSWSQHWH